MRRQKNSQEINPWTYRPAGDSFYGNHSSKVQNGSKGNTLVSKFALKKPNGSSKNYYDKKQMSSLDSIDNGAVDHMHYKRILRSNGEDYESMIIQKTPASYKVLCFDFNQRRQTTTKKQKKMPFNLKSLRHYTQGLVIHPPKQNGQNNSSYIKALKVKRYFTQQKDYQFNWCQQFKLQKHPVVQVKDLAVLSKTEEIKKNKQTKIKVLTLTKQLIHREKQIKSGKLYSQIASLCGNSNNLSGHLSLMKRNYNVKKLQKLLKNGQISTDRIKQ